MAYSQETGPEKDINLKELKEGLHFLSAMNNSNVMFSSALHHLLMVKNKIEEKPGTFDYIQGNLLERRKQKKYGFDYMRKGLKRLKQQRADVASFFEDYEGKICENWRKNEDLPSSHFKVDDHMSTIKQTSSEENQQKQVISAAHFAFRSWFKAQIEAATKKHTSISILSSKLLLEEQFTMTQEEVNVLSRLECACCSFKEHLLKKNIILDQIHEFLKLHNLELDKCMELLQVCVQSKIHGSKARSLAEIIKAGKALDRICSGSTLQAERCLKRIVFQVKLLKKIKAATYILKDTVVTMEKARPLIEIFLEDKIY